MVIENVSLFPFFDVLETVARLHKYSDSFGIFGPVCGRYSHKNVFSRKYKIKLDLWKVKQIRKGILKSYWIRLPTIFLIANWVVKSGIWTNFVLEHYGVKPSKNIYVPKTLKYICKYRFLKIWLQISKNPELLVRFFPEFSWKSGFFPDFSGFLVNEIKWKYAVSY